MNRIKFELTEGVVMTDEGLMKICPLCKKYKPLEDFPESKMHAFKRDDFCRACLDGKR